MGFCWLVWLSNCKGCAVVYMFVRSSAIVRESSSCTGTTESIVYGFKWHAICNTYTNAAHYAALSLNPKSRREAWSADKDHNPAQHCSIDGHTPPPLYRKCTITSIFAVDSVNVESTKEIDLVLRDISTSESGECHYICMRNTKIRVVLRLLDWILDDRMIQLTLVFCKYGYQLRILMWELI